MSNDAGAQETYVYMPLELGMELYDFLHIYLRDYMLTLLSFDPWTSSASRIDVLAYYRLRFLC